MTLKNNLTRYLSQKKCIDAVLYPAVANIILQYIGDPRLRWEEKCSPDDIFIFNCKNFRVLERIRLVCLKCSKVGRPVYNDICHLCYIEGLEYSLDTVNNIKTYEVDRFDFKGRIETFRKRVCFHDDELDGYRLFSD